MTSVSKNMRNVTRESLLAHLVLASKQGRMTTRRCTGVRCLWSTSCRSIEEGITVPTSPPPPPPSPPRDVTLHAEKRASDFTPTEQILKILKRKLQQARQTYLNSILQPGRLLPEPVQVELFEKVNFTARAQSEGDNQRYCRGSKVAHAFRALHRCPRCLHLSLASKKVSRHFEVVS